ncbi:MAG: hypothetical protein WCH62_06050 [Candidatus Omnitrophota bacterium]
MENNRFKKPHKNSSIQNLRPLPCDGNKGQSVIEYILLIGIVLISLIYMGTDFKRGIQSVLKVTADQMGNQINADQDFNYVVSTGVLIKSSTNSGQVQQKTIRETPYLNGENPGIITIQEIDSTQELINSITNQSFTAT